MDIKHHITVTPDWPRPGVNFLDIGGVLRDPRVFAECIDQMCEQVRLVRPTSLVAVESRGFVFAGAVAYQCHVPVYMARKTKRLPGPCVGLDYCTEYSQDRVELQSNAVLGQRPMIIDDLLATGGTVLAVAQLIRDHFSVQSLSAMTVINLEFLPGATELRRADIDIRYLVSYHA